MFPVIPSHSQGCCFRELPSLKEAWATCGVFRLLVDTVSRNVEKNKYVVAFYQLSASWHLKPWDYSNKIDTFCSSYFLNSPCFLAPQQNVLLILPRTLNQVHWLSVHKFSPLLMLQDFTAAFILQQPPILVPAFTSICLLRLTCILPRPQEGL